jgi:CheY-like chemotaxis protein/nitrogen-specific signal transduction histidine kinase
MRKSRKSADRQRRSKRAAGPTRARHNRGLDAKLADLAHEIRTPLTGILALSELLVTSPLGERERGWASAIKSTAEHLAMVASLIVDAGRADHKGMVLRRELMRPARFAEALAASLAARAAAKGLDHAAHVADDLPQAVIGDALRLRAAMENLIDNAVKFTAHGAVELAVAGEPAARDKIRLVFTVTDSGIGLSDREIRGLFRPFAQANARIAQRYGGAGLGLALAKRIARAMGGDLAVTSEPGRGSRFRFTAMVEPVAEASAPTETTATATPAPRALHILCVEDNPYGRVVLNTILTELGHRADFVGSGLAAIDAVAQGGYDVVLMDVTLPDVDGLEATRRIRALDGHAGGVPIVGLSGHASAADEVASRAAGMDGYLSKPLSPSTLARMLAAVARPR